MFILKGSSNTKGVILTLTNHSFKMQEDCELSGLI